MTQQRYVLLDRDGTINVERQYLSHPEQVRLLQGACEGLRRLRQLGLGLVIITNQSGIGRGYFDESQLGLIHDRLRYLLQEESVVLDGIYYCPHKPDDGCECRKPGTLLVEIAARQLGFDPTICFMIGDKPCDIELGKAVGALTFLVRTDYGTLNAEQGSTNADFIVNDLIEAAETIQSLVKR